MTTAAVMQRWPEDRVRQVVGWLGWTSSALEDEARQRHALFCWECCAVRNSQDWLALRCWALLSSPTLHPALPPMTWIRAAGTHCCAWLS